MSVATLVNFLVVSVATLAKDLHFFRCVSRWFVSIYDSKKGATTGITKSKTFFLGLSYSISSTDEAVFYKLEDDKITIVTTATDDFSIFADSTDIAKFLIQIISRSPT